MITYKEVLGLIKQAAPTQVQPTDSTPASGSVPAQGYNSTNPPPQNVVQSMGEYSQDDMDRAMAQVNNTPVAVEKGKRILNENIVAPIRQGVHGAVGAVNNAGQALTDAVQGGVNAIRSVAGTPSNASWTTPVNQLGRRPVSRGRIYNRPRGYYGRTWKGH